MIDLKLLREHPDLFRKDLTKRKDQEKLSWIDEVLAKDKDARALQHEVEQLRASRNKIAEEINTLKKSGKDITQKKKEAAEIPVQIKKKETALFELTEKINFYLMRLPNLMHESVPYGKDDTENVEVRKWGTIPKITFPIINHGEVAENLGIVDFKKASEVSGAGFYYLLGDLGLLNMALCQFAIEHMVQKGFTLVIPPLMLRRKPYEGVTDLSDFENVMYKIENDDLYLIATSEHPLAALMMNKVIKEEDLPLRFVGFSPCFRREIGSHGVDTKGLFRVHQFWKVEQFVYCKPEDSALWHEKLTTNSEEMYQALKIPYRIVNICTGDLGIVASKKFDLELWMPRQEAYKEACSCSNCTDFQARRLNIRYETKTGERKYVHTLNNTAIATSRAMVALLENNQQKDGSIVVPQVLQKYMMGKKVIGQKS